MYYIYKITNNVNGMFYIGKTINVRRRFIRHLSTARKGPNQYSYFSYLHAAIAKYGERNFSIETVSTHMTEHEAYETEKNLIKSFRDNNQLLYNLAEGGEGGQTGLKRGPMLQSTKDKLSAANKGQNNPKGSEHWAYGKSLSPEHRKKLSINNRNQKLSENDVKTIRQHLLDGKLLQKEIAAIFEVDPSVISDIKRNKAHVL